MTASKLQSIVRNFARGAWVRYWLHWNYPEREPWMMAIQARDDSGSVHEIPDLERVGFIRTDHHGTLVYVIERTDKDGSPFRSEL